MRKLTIIGAGRLGKSIHTMLSIPHNLITKDDTIPHSDIYYLTVPDKKIAQFATLLPQNSTIIHSSGALPHTILRPHMKAAVLHPLMTFPGPDIAIPPPPIFASISGDPQACLDARWLADKLDFQSFVYSGNRAQYHCAAVMAGNFGALLLDMAAQVMSGQSNMNRAEARKILFPLIQESIQNCAQAGPISITGPIVRNDNQTVQKHREELLSFSEHFLRSYDALTTSLIECHAQND